MFIYNVDTYVDTYVHTTYIQTNKQTNIHTNICEKLCSQNNCVRSLSFENTSGHARYFVLACPHTIPSSLQPGKIEQNRERFSGGVRSYQTLKEKETDREKERATESEGERERAKESEGERERQSESEKDM